MLDDLMVESSFYAAMHELAILAWRRELTVEALLKMTELVDPLVGTGSAVVETPRCRWDGDRTSQ
nr:hypothetical protein [Micromonospora sp. DSM 115978]